MRFRLQARANGSTMPAGFIRSAPSLKLRARKLPSLVIRKTIPRCLSITGVSFTVFEQSQVAAQMGAVGLAIEQAAFDVTPSDRISRLQNKADRLTQVLRRRLSSLLRRRRRIEVLKARLQATQTPAKLEVLRAALEQAGTGQPAGVDTLIAGLSADDADDVIVAGLSEELEPGLPEQKGSNPIHCYSCSRTQRMAKCCSSVAFRKFIFSLILAR